MVSTVVLPEPEGPSSVKNSPSSISSETLSTALTSPKLLERPAMEIIVRRCIARVFQLLGYLSGIFTKLGIDSIAVNIRGRNEVLAWPNFIAHQ